MTAIPNTIDEPVFIVGVSRSGTTLFEQILNRHPRLSIYYETHFLLRVWARANTAALDTVQLRDALDKIANLGGEGLKAKTIEQQFLATDRSLQALYDTILRLRMESNGKVRMGEKTPNNFWFLDVLFTWYPNARVIFMIRNPHSVHGSFKNHKNIASIPWRERTVVGRALYWNYAARVLLESQAKYPGQVKRVTFETLVQEPERVLPAVCNFLGETFYEEMLEIKVVNSSFDQISQQSGFRKETLQRQMNLNFWERLLIDGLCGTHILANDYPLSILPKWAVRSLEVLGFYSVLTSIHGALRHHHMQ